MQFGETANGIRQGRKPARAERAGASESTSCDGNPRRTAKCANQTYEKLAVVTSWFTFALGS